MNNKKLIAIRCTNHFDPIWRRGFKKEFHYNGEKYIHEGQLQKACIDDWLTMAENSSLKFEIECSLVLREYLVNNPEKLPVFKKLIKEGRFELLAAGEVIPDTNMPGGETLLRNLMYGLLWSEEALGYLPETGCLNDSFGQSAQIPQLFRGVGIKWVVGVSYKTPSKDYWRGLDGSIIYIRQDFRTKNKKNLGAGMYYRPCTNCKGYGCDICHDRGFDQSYRMDGELSPEGFSFEKYRIGTIETGGEETLVTMDLTEKVKKANEAQGEYEYDFMLLKDIAGLFKEDIDMVDDPDCTRLSPEIEGNPTSTGCLVSRIKVKQKVRQYENLIETYEKLSALTYLKGFHYPGEKLKDTWLKLVFTAFQL